MSLLTLRNLSVRYPAAGPLKAMLSGMRSRYVDAVLGVSLEIAPATTLAIVGESGSGKSSLARAITGLTPAAEGTILFNGVEPFKPGGKPGKAYHRDVAMMFQDPVSSLSPRRSVKALITEPFVIHGARRRDLDAEARRLLTLVGLPADFGERYPHQLSGGQARRVGVARAIALSPRLIIADEPTAGLDVSVQGEILNLLNRLQRELGLTYLIITHNLAIVRHISDRTAIMYMGRVVEEGPTPEIFAAARHPYTAALLAAQPNPDPARRRSGPALTGEVASLLARPPGCEFHARCPRRLEICSREVPEAVMLGNGHLARCHNMMPGS